MILNDWILLIDSKIIQGILKSTIYLFGRLGKLIGDIACALPFFRYFYSLLEVFGS